MKKGLIVLLIVVLLLGAVAVCLVTMSDEILGWFIDNAAESRQEEEASPYATLRELTIKLPETLKESKMESTDSYLVLRGDGYCVKIDRIDHSSITPNEGYSFPTVTEAMEFYLAKFGELTFAEEDGLLCADGDEDRDGTPDTLIVLFESEGAFWDIRFSATKAETSYETLRAQGLEWAKTVELDK